MLPGNGMPEVMETERKKNTENIYKKYERKNMRKMI